MVRALLAGAVALLLGGQPVLACQGSGTTRVDEIYPSGTIVPDNMLRFYLYFTAPMAEADILPRITLMDAQGMVVEGAFLANRYDLWSPDRTRLTLMFDPGRVKTGLDAHDTYGRALVEGEGYQLTIDASAVDAAGCRLQEGFSHSFAAGPSDMDPPDPGAWALELPRSGTTEPLHITLGSSHDHVSMAFRIQVQRNGAPLPGRLALGAAESVWLFTPRSPWADESHQIVVAPELEDLAGNRPGQLFDQPIGLELDQPDLRRSFRPGAG